MKLVFLFFIIIHGLNHLLGLVKVWDLAPVTQLSGVTVSTMSKNLAQFAGILWLVTWLLFMISAVGILLNKNWWWVLAIVGIMGSQALIMLYWKDTKWGTIVNIIILIICIISIAKWNFNRMVHSEVKELFAHETKNDQTIITNEMLNTLPAPVKLWLSNSGIVGKKKIHTVRLRQKGLMRSKAEQKNWVPMEAEQYVTIDEPSFIWSEREYNTTNLCFSQRQIR